jgi:hypothetical protein
MRYWLIGLLLLSSCATQKLPVAPKFPEPPGQVAEDNCPALHQLQNGVKLSEVAKTITENYTLYYQCSLKQKAWMEWYQQQKDVYNNTFK